MPRQIVPRSLSFGPNAGHVGNVANVLQDAASAAMMLCIHTTTARDLTGCRFTETVNLWQQGPLFCARISQGSMRTVAQHPATRVSQFSSRCPLLPQGEGQLVTSRDCYRLLQVRTAVQTNSNCRYPWVHW